MRLIIPAEVQRHFTDNLRSAGTREIGGLLMGEHVGPDAFRVLEVTVDHGRGSFARFVRAIFHHGRGLLSFFQRTGGQYQRFNYIGEWHSHPSFSLNPSQTDLDSMRRIVDDPKVGANFVVLLIIRLSAEGTLQAGALYFVPSRPDALPVDLVLDEPM